MTKFGVVFLMLLAAVAIVGVARRGVVDHVPDDRVVARNERVTALAGAFLYVLLVAIVATVLQITELLDAHYLVGFLLIPPTTLKIGSSGYRFVRYYVGSPAYRQAGAPPLLLRFVIAPLLVGSTIAVFATGVELWLFGLRFGSAWMEAHALSAVLMLVAATAHLLAHLRRSATVFRDDVVLATRATVSARPLVFASLLAGAVLAVASLFYASPFPPSAAGG